MIRVGSISGAWTVGGRKGVGVGAGEQAEMRKRVKTTASNGRLRAKWKRFEGGRSLIIKRATQRVAPTGHFIILLRQRHHRRLIQHPDPMEERFHHSRLFVE